MTAGKSEKWKTTGVPGSRLEKKTKRLWKRHELCDEEPLRIWTRCKELLGEEYGRFTTLNIYMLFAGWEVRMVKNCDRGLENAEVKAEVTVFHHTDRPLAGK